MSANLDKSLDDLVGNRRQSARRRSRRTTASKPSAVGGVKKSTKAAAKAVHPTPTVATASSKIIVSGLVRHDPFPQTLPVHMLINISLPM